MRKLTTILVMLIIAVAFLPKQSSAQSPQKMSYQAIIRNSSNVLQTNVQVGIRISILQGIASGPAVYVETQTPSTNANGLISIEIGGGLVISGTFASIDWANGPYFIKTETDPSGGTNYSQIVGTTQLLSVPYALYSGKAANGFSGNYNDLINKPMLWDSTWATIKNKPAFATVATSGNYTDLLNLPSIPAPQVNSDWNSTSGLSKIINKPTLWDSTWATIKNKPAFATVATSGNYTDLLNRPSIPASQINSDWNSVSGLSQILNRPSLWDSTWATIKNKPNYSDSINNHAVLLVGDQNIAGVKTFTGTISANNNKITNVATPTSTSDAVNKAYIDSIANLKVDKATGKALMPNGTAVGQVMYWDGSAWVQIAAGVNGQFLRLQNGLPKWRDYNDIAVGDYYQGGIVAYVLASGDPGYDANIKHGIIVAPTDQSGTFPWGINYNATGATGSALGTGNANTNAIVANQGAGSYAARVCYDLVLNGYSDWYLPSKEEMNKLYANRVLIGGISGTYWTSTEFDAANAYCFYFMSASSVYHYKALLMMVRAIRSL